MCRHKSKIGNEPWFHCDCVLWNKATIWCTMTEKNLVHIFSFYFQRLAWVWQSCSPHHFWFFTLGFAPRFGWRNGMHVLVFVKNSASRKLKKKHTHRLYGNTFSLEFKLHNAHHLETILVCISYNLSIGMTYLSLNSSKKTWARVSITRAVVDRIR